MQSELMTSEELGLLLGLGDPAKTGSAARAINVRIMRGHAVPPSIVIPHLAGRRWRRTAVDAWLTKFEGATRTQKQAARGGRPRKLDQLALQAANKPSGKTA